jgi:hypothetical protein
MQPFTNDAHQNSENDADQKAHQEPARSDSIPLWLWGWYHLARSMRDLDFLTTKRTGAAPVSYNMKPKRDRGVECSDWLGRNN